MLDLVASEFPKVTTAEELAEIREGIEHIENGMMPISYNDRQLTAKEVYEVIAQAGYFERNEAAAQMFASIQDIPFAPQLFWLQFKNYCFESFRILSVVFDLIQEVEKHSEYKEALTPKESPIKKCIYCLTEDGPFTSEEHIFPETLAGDEIFLAKGFVCDPCNNGISSKLDEALISFEPIAFLRVQFGPMTKAGKFPKANFQNMVMEKTDPNHIQITAKDKTARPKNKRTLEDGREAFTMDWTGKRLDWIVLARAIYKIGLGFVAYDRGHEEALTPKFQAARDFIVQGKPFSNNMLVSTKSKPHPSLRSYSDVRFGGSPYFIDIFGMIFMVNLEPEPKLRMDPRFVEEFKSITDQYEFDLIPLFDDEGESETANA
ncbi:MAG: hypothetical protein JO314_03110 [Acidobacteria bacterium]|nr:hypothetical protein [Acidobacteriota bacterium]